MRPNHATLVARSADNPAARRLLELIAEMLRELRPGASLQPVRLGDSIERDLGLDSLSRAELRLRIERSFRVRLPERLAVTARTPRDLLEAIAAAESSPEPASLPAVPTAPPEPVEGTPEHATTLPGAFRWHAERHPDRVHITLVESDEVRETVTYSQLWDESGNVAQGFAAHGVKKGDTVALMLPTGSAFFHAFLGALRIGAIPVPMYPPLRWSEIEEHVLGRMAILANAQARVLVTVPEGLFIGRILQAQLPHLAAVASVERLRARAQPAETLLHEADTAMLQYTSGSTGDPKGVVLSHQNMLANIRVMGRAAAATSSDRFLSWLPLYHDMGLIGAWLATMYYAVPLVLMSPTEFLSRPARWLRGIHRFGATISAGPNFAYEIVASKVRDEDLAGLDLRSWRLAFNGAEPVRAATLERFAARFARYGFDRRALTPVYGLAEATLGLGFPPLGRGPRVDRIDAGALARASIATPVAQSATNVLDVVSSGRPLRGCEVRVVDEAGSELPERAEGRLEFRGPSATSGYFRNPKATAALFHDDWLDTGDVGYIADGEIFLTSRAKDLIKRGGHNLHPYDLEAAIGEIPGIRKGCVAVFGTTDQAAGTERVVVVAEANRTDPASQAALRKQIADLATIHLGGPADEVLLVPARTVLKTSSGKIRRAACRELYEKGMLQAPRRAVWLQLSRLVWRAATAQAWRGLRAIGQGAYGVHCWLLFALATAMGLPVLALLRNEATRMRFAHGVARAVVRGCALPVRVEGLEHLPRGQPAVIAANHSSYIDAMILVAVLPPNVHFAAKREFGRTPVIGFALRRLGAYFVERIDPAGGIEDTRELTSAAARRGQTVVFFPEGTFSRAPGLRAFRLGAFVVAAESGAPIVPLVLRGTRSALREGRWMLIRHPIEVVIEAPIAPQGRSWSAAVQLRDRVRDVMLRRCAEPDLAG